MQFGDLVSCLMVSKAGRLEHVRSALACFQAQTYENKELVVVCDQDESYYRDVERLVASSGVRASCVFLPGRTSLGTLRNVSMDHARGPLVSQWDDDDLYHAERLRLQIGTLIAEGADLTFMTDQLHFYADSGDLYWMDWLRDSAGVKYPVKADVVAVPGTLVAKTSHVPRYPDEPIGEDSMLIESLPSTARVALTPHLGWTYLKVFHGCNSWDRQQNEEITDHVRWRLTLDDTVSWSTAIRLAVPDFNLVDALHHYGFRSGVRLTFGGHRG